MREQAVDANGATSGAMGKTLWVVTGTTIGALVGFWYQNKKLIEFRELQAQQKALRQEEMGMDGAVSGTTATNVAVPSTTPDSSAS